MAPQTKARKGHNQSAAKSRSLQQDNADGPETLSWPAMVPRMPSEDLEMSVLLTDQILTISKLWTATLCKRYVEFLASLPLTTTPGKPKKGEAVRVNDRFQIDDPAFAERLWNETALSELVHNTTIDGNPLSDEQRKDLWGGKVLGLNSNIRVYRYTPGQFFAQHYDESNNMVFRSSQMQDTPARTTWTLLLYLTAPSTGCIGGETVFYPDPVSKRAAQPEPVVAELEVGMALLHRHGAECLLHEGREVRAGEKWVIRSDICVKS